MKDDTLEKNISEQLLAFEKAIVEEKKQNILKVLLKEKPSKIAQLIFVFNNALLGFSLGKLFSFVFLDEAKLGILGTLLSLLIMLASFRYVKNYYKRKINQSKFTHQVTSLKNLKEIKKYLYDLPSMFNHSFLFMHNEKINDMHKQNSTIKNEEIKSFIQGLSQEQLNFIMEVLQKNTLDEGFKIQLVDDIKKICAAKKRIRNKEEKLLNNLKALKDNLDINKTEDEDDLLNAMAEHYLPGKKEEKINFKKIL